MERKDKMGKEQQGGGGKGGQQKQQTQGQGQTGGKSGRFVMDCRTAGQDCSLVVMGGYDEVLEVGMAHCKTTHGMTGDDDKIRQDVKGYIKDASGWDMERGFEGGGKERESLGRGQQGYGDGGFQGKQSGQQGGMAGQGGSGTSPSLPA